MSRAALLSALLLAAFPVAACASAQDPTVAAVPAAQEAAKTAHFWFASYPDFLVEFDPATDAVARKVKLQNGMSWGVQLLADQKRFAVITDTQRKVEVVDIAKGAVTEVHDFGEADVIVRVRDVTECPGGKQWYVRTERLKKLADRYEFQQGQILLYDLEQKKSVRTLRRMPPILGFSPRISPDGQSWHVFQRDGAILVVDPKTLKETAKIDLATPQFAGQGRISLRRTDLHFGREPQKYRMLCSFTDPVQRNRQSWGYVDIDLVANKVVEMVEWGPGPSGFGMYVSRDGKLAASSNGGWGGERESAIALHDLATGKKVREFREEFRPRQSLSAIAPDGSKVYVGGAGSDFRVYDATTCKLLKVVEFDGEIQGQVFVVDV